MVKTLENKKVKDYPYPSRFGSHSSMVKELVIPGVVKLTDEFGDYTTEASRLDTGIADPNRFAESRLSKLFARSIKEKE